MLQIMNNINNLIKVHMENLKFKSNREGLPINNYYEYEDVEYLCEAYNILVKAAYKEEYWKESFLDIKNLNQ